jgi:hypothetical protein
MPAKPQKAKALLRYLIAELKVSSRAKSQPTYRVITGTVAQCPKSGRNQTLRKPPVPRRTDARRLMTVVHAPHAGFGPPTDQATG